MIQKNNKVFYLSRDIFVYILGLGLSSVGVALSLYSQLGISTWDAVFAAFEAHTQIAIGVWSIIIQFTFWCITSILNKKAQITCIIPIVIRGITLDVSKNIISSFAFESALSDRFSLFFSGYALVGIGIGIYVSTGFPRLPIDGLMMALSKYFLGTINKSRFIIEITGFVIALILRGPIGIGTIIITLTIAPFITLVQKIMFKLLRRKEKSLG
jgi:uncharacterized membrane protein YczE